MTNRLLESLMVTLTGLCIVFAGLILLICLIKLLTMATAKIGQKKEKKPEAAPVEAAVTEDEPEEVTDNALIAVISAAVACMMEENTGFTVRHIRRISNTPAWSKAGREEDIYSHF